MICWSGRVYHENRDKEIEEDTNPHYGEPFSAFRGHVLFRACHCPGKSTVFGIEKQNQDVYNKEELAELIGKTVITRKFRDFAGEKYRIRTHTVSPSDGEREVYRVIIEEFCRICELYYNSTGDEEGCRTPAYAPDQAAHQGLFRPTPDRGLFRRRDSEQDKVHRKAGTEDTRQSGCRLHVHSRIRPLREPSPRMFSGASCIRGQGRRGVQETTKRCDGVRFHRQRHTGLHAAEPEQFGEHTHLQRRDT